MSGVLLDTSILISAADEGIELEEDSAISVVTIGELGAGVDLAKTAPIRSARQARLSRIMEVFAPIPVNESIAIEYGRLLAVAKTTGRIQKATDLLISATASVRGRTLWTLDNAQASLASEAGVAVRPF